MKETIYQGWQQSAWPSIKSTEPLATGEGIIDQSAFNTMEVDKVFEAINYASTTIGQARLYRSLTQPSTTLEEITEKQQALEELRANPALRDALENIIATAASQERNFYLLTFGEFLGSWGTAREEHEIEGYGYLQYKRGVRFMLDLVDQVQDIATPQSDYLKSLIDAIKQKGHSVQTRKAAFIFTRHYL